MSVSNIQQIRDVEKESEVVIRKAENDAKELLAKARASVEAMRKKVKDDTEVESKRLKAAAKEATENEISMIEKNAANRKSTLHESKKEKMNEATDLIVKIVTE